MALIETMTEWIPKTVKDTWMLRTFGLMKIPLLAFTTPKVLKSTDEKAIVSLPLNYRTKNHLGSMYFGALAIGADTAVGLLALTHIQKSPNKILLIFKDFKAEYFKRAEGHTHFICEEGRDIADLVQQAIETKERVEKTITAFAIVPEYSLDEPVARFELTLSLKEKP